MSDCVRILILGGGFGGVYTAMHLQRLIGHNSKIEIALVNRENYFVFQPMLAEVVSGNIGLLDTVSPISRLIPNCRLYIREIESVDLQSQTVTLAPGSRPQPLVLPWDHLVLAAGTVTDFRGMTGLQQHAMPFKTLADAVRLRNHLLNVLHEADIEPDPERRRQLLTCVVAGGGFSGVEVAAEINDFLRAAAARLHAIKSDDIRVVLVHSGQRILERELSESLSLYAQKKLRKRGVELRLGVRMQTATADAAVLAGGERIPARTVVSTVPAFANPLLASLPLQQESGRLVVDHHLQVAATDNVWAIGDAARIPNGRDGGFAPPTAQHAIREAAVLAHNITARIRGGKLREFCFPGLGKMGSLGHHSAVAELFGRIRLSGFPAWVMWRFVYWWKLPGFDRRLRVAFSWLLDLLVPPDMVQLRLESQGGVQELHFEPGEYVFREGDRADSLYVIVSGSAEVVAGSTDAFGERVLNVMQAGEFFGEIAMLQNRTRTASVRCLSPMNVLAMPQRQFQTLSKHLPQFRAGFQAAMEERLQRGEG
jgi:NADH dehydrogenase